MTTGTEMVREMLNSDPSAMVHGRDSKKGRKRLCVAWSWVGSTSMPTQCSACGGSWVRLRHLLFHENSFFIKSPIKLKVSYLREISLKAAYSAWADNPRLVCCWLLWFSSQLSWPHSWSFTVSSWFHMRASWSWTLSLLWKTVSRIHILKISKPWLLNSSYVANSITKIRLSHVFWTFKIQSKVSFSPRSDETPREPPHEGE